MLACGPFFPNQLLSNGDAGVLNMPAGVFSVEISRLQPPVASPFKSISGDPYAQSVAVDVSELAIALTARHTPRDQQTNILSQYKTARKTIERFARPVEENFPATQPTARTMPDLDVPANLPAEFDAYLRGMIAFQRGDLTAARNRWLAVLALPTDQRHLRTTWAMFMLGKSYLKGDPAQANNWFIKTREAAAQGFADGLALASSSFGWQGRAELNAGHVTEAIGLYLQQKSTGDDTAVYSLQRCAAAAFKGGPSLLAGVARDPLSLQVVAVYALCSGGPWNSFTPAQKQLMPALLDAVEADFVQDLPNADRLAWAAYNAGDFPAAGRWASRAPQSSAIAQWIRAKLLLRAGKIDAATALLSRVVQSFPDDKAWAVYDDPIDDTSGQPPNLNPSVNTADAIVTPLAGDLAVLNLARGQYTDALLLLLKGDYWMDAAYVAERVLTVDELKAFVDHHCPLYRPATPSLREPNRLQHLLARRLARAGRWREARPYYPADLQPQFDAYITGIRTGNDTARSDADRAAAFMTAARTAKKFGMELLGTELAPDFFCHDGNYEYDGNDRLSLHPSLVAPSRDERSRVHQNEPADNRRFHYRYIALDHAWAAIQLMPDESDATARAMCEAGNWIAARDPEAANRFYRALIKRCSSTVLGQQAAAVHWFPNQK